jgi:hypothetical protein
MNGKILGFLIAALMAAPMAANAQFTYDYTGVITSSNDDQDPIGSQVSGTFTFDYANDDPALSSGTIGSANWIVVSSGCSSVFATKAGVVGGFFYSTPVSGHHPCGVHALVQGSANSGAAGGSIFTASEAYNYSPGSNGSSSLSISNPHGAYSITGLPILAGATSATGEITQAKILSPFGYYIDKFDFNITSLTPRPSVPLTLACPAAAAQAGVPYSSALIAAGGFPTYTFSISSGSLPAGLTLNTSNGAVTGTPSAAAEPRSADDRDRWRQEHAFNFTAQVVDSSGLAAGTVTSSCTITVSPPPVSQQLAALLTEVTGVGPGKSLAAKVMAAQAYYAASNTQATCAVLSALVNEVIAQNEKMIGHHLDAKIITDTQTIKAALGCH